MTDNPYESPASQPSMTAPPKFFLWGVVTVFGSAALGGTFGAVIGLLLGRMMPEYYRSVFYGGHEPGFDPVAVGVGQGLTQGIIFGAVIGWFLVGFYCWYRSRVVSANK